MATLAMGWLQRLGQAQPLCGTSTAVRAPHAVMAFTLLLLAVTEVSASGQALTQQNKALQNKAQQAMNAAAPANSCSGCHGQSSSSALPALSLLSADEVAMSMLAFKNGTRSATLMNRIARGFSDEEIRQLAVWVTQ